MPSRPINQQSTSGPDAELKNVVYTAVQVISYQRPLTDKSNAVGGKKRAPTPAATC